MKCMLSVAAALAIGAVALPAQGTTEQYTLLTVIGRDTVASEVVQRSPLRLDVDMVNKSAALRIHIGMALTADARVSRVSNAVFRLTPPDSVPRQTAELEFVGDSVRAVIPGAPARMIGTSAGALPYIRPSVAVVEQVLLRAKAIGGTSATIPVFAVAGGQTFPVVVSWNGADSATLAFPGIVMRFAVRPDGHLVGGTVAAQGALMIRVDGVHPIVVAKPNYGAPPGAPYTAEEVTVHTAQGLNFAGTLTLPARRSGQRVPAIVTITGSGSQDRDEGTPVLDGWRPFRQVADTLARRGIAVLRLDDRGVGGSDLGPQDATSADFANDIRGALAYLRTRPEIDGARLGLVGHSEGGMIAPMIAATDPTLAGIVLMAGPAWNGRRVSDDQVRSAFEHDTSLTPAKRAAAIAANEPARDALLKTNAWLRYWFDYDPIPTARRVRTPVLILQGATDRQVTPDQAEQLAVAFRSAGNKDVTVRLFPNANHLFAADPDGHPEGYLKLPSLAVRPEVLGALADWLTIHLR